jgi:hypothetical protein
VKPKPFYIEKAVAIRENTQAASAAVMRWRAEREAPLPNFRGERVAEFENTLTGHQRIQPWANPLI